MPSLPPRQLEKLEKRRKKKRVLTEDEIKAKLEKAELRRKVRFLKGNVARDCFSV